MNKLIDSITGLFKWSGESSWTGIVKGVVVVSLLSLIGLSIYLAYIGQLPWSWLLIALGAIVIIGMLFIFNNEDAKFDRWYEKMKKNEFDEEVSNRDRRIETMPIIQ